ncbi:AraC family transcriptional regulator [Kribbella monticola]|uniref:AraC family transcriptional regulator n=1 Tax=Kribbella monticola TaxID=2185285 RepID=UPI000DD44A9F|nr:AraC family transcriptional regulator [Kribbella monticola]
MDVLSDLLQRAQATNALVRQFIAQPPWSVTYDELPSLSVVAALGGCATLRIDDGAPATLAANDIALITGVRSYTIADDPATPSRYVIRGNTKYLDGRAVGPGEFHAPRTYGDGLGGTTIVRGVYDLRGAVGRRLLDLLPPVAIVPATDRTRPALSLLASETAREEPGQDAVLRRLLDFVLVVALRAWWAGPDATPPSWYQALTAPGIGDALRLLHDSPAHRWTVAELAAKVAMSRATFAARFTELVGAPPLTYLTSWRMALAADLLQDPAATVASVARAVGYEDPFAFAVAFKRVHGLTPSAWRR